MGKKMDLKFRHEVFKLFGQGTAMEEKYEYMPPNMKNKEKLEIFELVYSLCHGHPWPINSSSFSATWLFSIGQVLKETSLYNDDINMQKIQQILRVCRSEKVTSLFIASTFNFTLRAIFPTSSTSFSIRFLIAGISTDILCIVN